MIEQLVHDVLNRPDNNLIIECIWGDQQPNIQSIRRQLEQIERELGITFTDERMHGITDNPKARQTIELQAAHDHIHQNTGLHIH